jgi:mRNA interferase MazF
MENQVKGYPFEVRVLNADAMGGGTVLSDQVKSLAWSERRAVFMAKASDAVMREVSAKVEALSSL